MKFKIYRDNKKEWRWRLVARNGKTIAVSGEGYKNKNYIRKIIAKIKEKASMAKVEGHLTRQKENN